MIKLVPIFMLAIAACTSSLDPATLIARDRVLGAKVTVDGDLQRAWPAPGDAATITWITTSPGAPPKWSWVLAACPAATTEGLPICAGPVFTRSQATGPVPVMQLAIPADLASPAVAVMGAICATGAPVIDATTFVASCDDGSLPDEVSDHIFITRDGATNHHPTIVDAPFTLAGAAWSEGTAVDCADLPVIAAGTEKLLVGMTFAAAARELFVVPDDPTPWREELQLSPFATAGELVERYAYVEADDARDLSPVAVEWTAPSAADVPADGLRVTFDFVVRDLRGGIDSTRRSLCVR
jgi:hypothetical protein